MMSPHRSVLKKLMCSIKIERWVKISLHFLRLKRVGLANKYQHTHNELKLLDCDASLTWTLIPSENFQKPLTFWACLFCSRLSTCKLVCDI